MQQLIKRQGLFPLGSLVAFENGDLGFVKQQDASYQPEVMRLVYNKFSQQALEPKDLLVSSLEPEQKKLLPEDPAKYHLDNSVLLHKLN